MANTINKASSAALHTTVQNYYDGKLLMEMEKRLVYYQGGQRRSLPKGSGRVAEFWRYEPFDAVTTALTEGVVPDGQTLSMSKVTAEVKAYGGYVATTDVLDLTGVNTQTNQLVHLMARQGALSVDHIVRDVIFGGTNAMYCGKKAARDAVTAADKLTSKELRKAVKALKKNHAQTFGGYYIAIVGPDTMYDLQEDEAFIKVSQYQDKENIYTGEVGRLFGVRLVETTEAKIFEGKGASGADVASVIVLGKYAYGITSLKGSKPSVIVKPAGSAGTADPLDQISTVGWKMDGFGVKMLQPEYAVRIECGFSA